MNTANLEPGIEAMLRAAAADLGLGQVVRREPSSSAARRDHDLVVTWEQGREERARLLVGVCANPRRLPVEAAASHAVRAAASIGAIPVVAVPRLGAGLR